MKDPNTANDLKAINKETKFCLRHNVRRCVFSCWKCYHNWFWMWVLGASCFPLFMVLCTATVSFSGNQYRTVPAYFHSWLFPKMLTVLFFQRTLNLTYWISLLAYVWIPTVCRMTRYCCSLHLNVLQVAAVLQKSNRSCAITVLPTVWVEFQNAHGVVSAGSKGSWSILLS